MAGRLRRTVAAVTLVALLLPMAAATSLADTGPAPTEDFKVSSNGYSASAGEGGCDRRGRHRDVYLQPASSSSPGTAETQGSGAIHGTEVCYNTGTDVFNPVTGEVTELDPGVRLYPGRGRRDRHRARPERGDHRADHDHPRNISCDEVGCGPTGETRDVTVEGTFTATSTATRESNRDVFDDGICVFPI